MATGSTTDWLTAIGTVGAVVLALGLALFQPWVAQLFFRPKLRLEAEVERPAAILARRRWIPKDGSNMTDLGQFYYFRLAIANEGNAPAHDVQVFLSKVERICDDGVENVDRFTPMNLCWSDTDELPSEGRVTRALLLADTPPVYCDLIHIGDPTFRKLAGEELDGVPSYKTVLGLDVQFPTYTKGHLLEPGTYLLHLTLAASNCSSTHHTVKISCTGEWLSENQMYEVGFKMKKL